MKKVLVVDIGGTHVKALASGRRIAAKLPSGPHLTPRQMVKSVLDATKGWTYDVVSIGYPGLVDYLVWIIIGLIWITFLALRPRGVLPARRFVATPIGTDGSMATAGTSEPASAEGARRPSNAE